MQNSTKQESPDVRGDFDQKINFLYNAIQDTQETIKFTDTKSGTVVVIGAAFITAIVTLVDKYISLFNSQSGISKWILMIGLSVFSICLSISLYLSIKSINPSNNPNEHVEFGDSDIKVDIQYYLTGLSPKMRFRDYLKEWKDSKFSTPVQKYYNSIKDIDSEGLLLSLTYEFIKLSYIKDKKHNRTQCALKWLGKCLFTLVLTIILYIGSQSIQSINLNAIVNKESSQNNIYWLIIGYYAIRFLSIKVLFQKINFKSGWLLTLLNSVIYTIIVGCIGYLLHGFSVLDVILIFLSSLLITRINLSVISEKMKLKKIDSDNRLSLLINDFLHIGVLMILSILRI